MDTPPSPSAPIHIKPKVGKNDFGCAGIAVAVLLVVVVLVLFVIAKSGVLRIPLFSNLYHSPMPTRVVSASLITPADFTSLLQTRLVSQMETKNAPPYEVALTEQELTGALSGVIPSALRGSGWTVESSQMAITSSSVELLGLFQRGAFHADVLVHFVPRINEGGLSFDPVSFQLGDYPLPPALMYPLVSFIFSRDLGTWSINFGSVKLEGIQLKNGELDLQTSGPS
ncbi:MAG: hypothetical protein WA001_03820 [Patescibacteria group bacterium]